MEALRTARRAIRRPSWDGGMLGFERLPTRQYTPGFFDFVITLIETVAIEQIE